MNPEIIAPLVLSIPGLILLFWAWYKIDQFNYPRYMRDDD